MNSIQLDKILKSNIQTSKIFMGVFARDELPRIEKFPCCFILNTAKRTHPGKHWIALYFDSNKVCNFFDSYGNKPKFFDLDEYIALISNKVVSNNKTIQSWKSHNCGFYCVLFLILRSSGHSMEKFCNLFYDQPDKNDEMIEKYKLNF